jgi:hypothetical protein
MKFRTSTRIVLFLWSLSTLPVYAETVMLFTREAEGANYFELVGIDFAAAVEDGIMEVFFDEGHIIFNYGLPGKRGVETPFPSEPVPVRAAKSGGATFLIEIELSNPPEPGIAPLVVTYRYSDVIRERLISSGVVRLEEIDDGSITDARELCAAIGRAIAFAALSG